MHDRRDGNGDAHLKAGLAGLSETVPVLDGKPGLSTWQNIFLCEFDGPRAELVSCVRCSMITETWRVYP
ncbi:MAG TPA: YjbQ family protein [Gammaproteobacteria bacterium]|nr:YjbQ family protein [Gammaproteobacteria bacterium]